MKYVFTLKDKTNILDINYDYDYEDENLMLFNLLECNMACDCNRIIYMYDKSNFHNSKC